MIFPLIALAAPIAALNVETTYEAVDIVTNEQATPFLVTFINQEPDAVTVNNITLNLRTPNKDYRKTYANYSYPVNEQVASGERIEIPVIRTFSVPTKKYDVLFDVDLTTAQGSEKSASPVSTIKFQDPELAWGSPKFILSVVTVLAFIGAFAFLLVAIVRPDLLDQYIFTESTKPKEKKRVVEPRVRTPDAPDAWLPEKHKKKGKKDL